MKITKNDINKNVWHFRFGWGKIKKIELKNEHPICVYFKDGTVLEFTTSGKYVESDVNPSIFWKNQIRKEPINALQ